MGGGEEEGVIILLLLLQMREKEAQELSDLAKVLQSQFGVPSCR